MKNIQQLHQEFYAEEGEKEEEDNPFTFKP
jgi:hypothetical protein